MIANVSQYLGKVTLKKLWDYCLLSNCMISVVRLHGPLNSHCSAARWHRVLSKSDASVSAELGVTIFWVHFYLMKTGCHEAKAITVHHFH